MSTIFNGETVRELCEIIAPRSGGVEDGPNAKGTGVFGATTIAGIDYSTLHHITSEAGGVSWEIAETLLLAAFPNSLEEQDRYRNMEGYPARPAIIVLEEVAQELELPESLPSLKEFFDAALRLKNRTQGEITMTNATDLLSGRSECDIDQANALLEEAGFENGLDSDFVQQAHNEIVLFARRQTELGAAIYALRHYPEACNSAEEGMRSNKITLDEIATGTELTRSAINSYINMGVCPPLPNLSRVIAFFQGEIAGIVNDQDSLPKKEGPWDEAYFYHLAQIIAELYPEQCDKLQKAQPSEEVKEWGRCLNALIETLGITEDNIATRTSITQGSINNYRNAKIAQGPRRRRNVIQEACGCENDAEFLEYGQAAQNILRLRDQAAAENIILRFRESRGITQDAFEREFGISHSFLSNLESGRSRSGNPEEFAAKIGFGAASQGEQRERLPAEFYFYEEMGLNPNRADFKAIQDLRDRIQPLYPHLQQTTASETATELPAVSGAAKSSKTNINRT